MFSFCITRNNSIWPGISTTVPRKRQFTKFRIFLGIIPRRILSHKKLIKIIFLYLLYITIIETITFTYTRKTFSINNDPQSSTQKLYIDRKHSTRNCTSTAHEQSTFIFHLHSQRKLLTILSLNLPFSNSF